METVFRCREGHFVAALFLQLVPSTLVSDRDPIFTSHFWGRLLELLGIHANRSLAFHPQTDGQTERLNSVLGQYLRMYCDYEQTDWASLLPMAEFSYNNSKHSADPVLRELRVPSPNVPASPIPKLQDTTRGLVRAAAL